MKPRLLLTLEQFNAYLRGGLKVAKGKQQIDSLKAFIETNYRKENKQDWGAFNRDFNQFCLFSSQSRYGTINHFGPLENNGYTKKEKEAILAQLKLLLDNSGIRGQERSRYLLSNHTIHGLLSAILASANKTKAGNPRVSDILTLVQAKTTERNKWHWIAISFVVVLGAGLIAAAATGNLSLVLKLVDFVKNDPVILPIINIIQGTAFGALALYDTNSDAKNPFSNKVRDNVFMASYTITNVAAQAVLLSTIKTIGATNPTTAILCAVAAGISLLKEIVVAGQLYSKYCDFVKLQESQGQKNSLAAKLETAALWGAFEKQRNEVLINLAATAVTVAAVVVMAFVPELLIAAGIAMAVAFAFQKVALCYNENAMRKKLDEKLGTANKSVVCDRKVARGTLFDNKQSDPTFSLDNDLLQLGELGTI